MNPTKQILGGDLKKTDCNSDLAIRNGGDLIAIRIASKSRIMIQDI